VSLLTPCYATGQDEARPGRTRGRRGSTREHESGPPATGQDGRCGTHNPSVVGSSPTCPTFPQVRGLFPRRPATFPPDFYPKLLPNDPIWWPQRGFRLARPARVSRRGEHHQLAATSTTVGESDARRAVLCRPVLPEGLCGPRWDPAPFGLAVGLGAPGKISCLRRRAKPEARSEGSPWPLVRTSLLPGGERLRSWISAVGPSLGAGPPIRLRRTPPAGCGEAGASPPAPQR
jgi:hypothetical protein